MYHKIIGVLLLFGTLNATAQEIETVTNKFLIRNAFVITEAGKASSVQDVLVENGLIKDVGIDLIKPFDAELMMLDSMYVYPGFIAALSHVGLEAPKEDRTRPKVDRPGYPPNEIAGITPEMTMRRIFKPTDKSVEEFRSEGFTIANTVPYGRMLPGQSSVVSLSGRAFNEVVLKENESLFAQLQGASGVFPATTIGVMTKYRELYRNAELANNHRKTYQANPAGKLRPTQDDAEEAFFPVIEKKKSVIFNAEDHLDVSRALNLQKDLGFNLILASVKQADLALTEITGQKASVLLSLDLPKEEKAKKDDAKAEGEKDTIITKWKQESLDFEKRKTESTNNYLSQGSKLSSAGVTFAFALIDSKPKDALGSIRRLIKSGLSEDKALAALTSDAAKILGIDAVSGSISKGKIANLVVMTAPFSDEKAKIKIVFVDGIKHEFEIKAESKKDGDKALVDMGGKWDYKIDVPGMNPFGTMTIKKDGSNYDITLTLNQSPDEIIEVNDVKPEGSSLVFSYQVSPGGSTITVNADLNFDGDSFDGTVSVPDFGNFEITGTRVEKPKN